MRLKYRPALFIVTYAKNCLGIKYILLKRKLHWSGWEFPKGGIEKKEKISDCIKREVKEETGLDVLKITKFNKIGKYKYDKKYSNRPGFSGQNYKLYSAKVKKPLFNKIKLDKKEHSDYKWVSKNKALRLLTWPNQKKCLRIVSEKIK